MPETTPLIKAALNLRVGAGFDVYIQSIVITILCVFPRFYVVNSHKKRQRITNLSICAVYTRNKYY